MEYEYDSDRADRIYMPDIKESQSGYYSNQDKQPFYMTYPMIDYLNLNDRDEKDTDYLKRLYPKTMREIQKYVEDECDKMEYDGSVMFDEYPDKIMLRKIAKNIYEMVNYLEKENQVEANQFGYRYYGRNNWLNDIIEVLLLNEIYRRRCRYRNCRRWQW